MRTTINVIDGYKRRMTTVATAVRKMCSSALLRCRCKIQTRLF